MFSLMPPKGFSHNEDTTSLYIEHDFSLSLTDPFIQIELPWPVLKRTKSVDKPGQLIWLSKDSAKAAKSPWTRLD